MANKKVTALTENTGPASEDLVYSVDDPSGTPASRKVTVQNLLQVIPTRTVNTTPATSDYVVIIDDPAGSPTVQHITIENLLKGILTSTGDILYRNSGGTITSLGLGSPTNSLAVNSGGDGLEWVAGASGGGGAASMINNSGGTVAANSVVIMDTSGTAYFTTSTVDHDTRIVGIVGAAVNPGGTASVQTGIGKMDALVSGSIDIGDWLIHSGTAGHLYRYGPVRPYRGGAAIAFGSNTSGTATISVLLHTDPWNMGAGAENGYLVAGKVGGSNVDTAEKKVASSGTWSALGSVWPRTIRHLGGAGDGTKGYTAHGYTTGATAYLDKMTYATDTGSACTTISGSKYSASMSGGDLSVTAYVTPGIGAYTTWNQIAYSTDTQSGTKTVTGDDYSGNSYVGDATGGYSYKAGGYYSSAYRNTVFRTTHSTDTPASWSTIGTATRRLGGLLDDYNNEEYIYWPGGETGAGDSAVTNKLTIATSTITTSGALGTARDNPACISFPTYGVVFTKWTTPSWDTTEDFSYATETWSAGSTLSTAQDGGAGLTDIG